jgi:hypothetical protein
LPYIYFVFWLDIA